MINQLVKLLVNSSQKSFCGEDYWLVNQLVNVLVNSPLFWGVKAGRSFLVYLYRDYKKTSGAEALAVCRVRLAEQVGYRIPRFGYVRLGDSQTPPDKIRKARI